MVLFPNAKINLGLHVTEKRPDGFHNIETIFLPVELCDILEFVESTTKRTQLTVTGTILDGSTDDNLVVKAWKLMHAQYDIPEVEVHLHKLIPTGAGLGGGSADAAFMLKGLNEHFSCGAGINELEQLAARLGSDCAFFIRNRPAYAEGRGELLEPANIDLSNFKILLINPDIHVNTGEAYAGVVPQIPDISLKQMTGMAINEWQRQISNDFEPSIFEKYPLIESIKNDLLRAGAAYAAMSGSGSTIYGIFKSGENVQEIISCYRKNFYWYGDFVN